MGGHENLSGVLFNGLLPNESASVIRVLDRERWAKAEERTAELIACIQPNQPSEDRRGAVADYVQRLITKCFPCQVVTFGSVPLKTYLPDGDIDVTAFSKNQNLKDTWAVQVRDVLENEEKNENAEFRVKEVQYIKAEVKIIKCLVENIVVDISFNQLGGLCTLCFLEEVDNLINQDHLFKRSIILIKAWCYYESRILGAHHGLISTYALETLVLYIFHIFNNSFTGPLEVLYRFLEFFCKFDWENFCVSLWGPVPVSSLPDINAEPPRKDGGELLLSKDFLQACNAEYAVYPGELENQGQPFISKHLNVIDPLRINNNLGRSVNKGNFFRIRSAFAFGAKRLARLLDCPKENIAHELNQFFLNTWERHGSGIRPDVPKNDSECSRRLNPDPVSHNHLNSLSNKESNGDVCTRITEVESTSNCSDARTGSSAGGQKANAKQSCSRTSDRPEKVNSKLSIPDISQKTLKHDQIANQLQSKHLFARTRSSPELTNAYRDASSGLRRIKPAESGIGQVAASKIDRISSQRKSIGTETMSAQSAGSSSDHMLGVPVNSTSALNSHIDDSGTVSISEDRASVIGAQGMALEEQDLVNMMASSSLHNFGGHIPMPLNLASSHLPLTISPSVFSSMGYGQRSVAGMFPPKTPVIDPHWAAHFQFHQGLMSNPLSQYFPGVGLFSKDVIEHGDENLSSLEMRRGADSEHWHERNMASNGGFDLDDGTTEALHVDDMQPSTSGSSAPFLKVYHKEHPTSMRDGYVDQHQDNGVIENCSDERISGGRYPSTSQTGSVRSKTSSESSWDGSSARSSKAAREKRGRKAAASTAASSRSQVKGKNIHEYASSEVGDVSTDLSTLTTTGNEIDESVSASQTAHTMHVGQHYMPGRGTDNSGVGRYTFYPTGPPVPFFTMLPVYNYPHEAHSSEPSSSPMGGDDSLDNSDSGQNSESSERHDIPDVSNAYNNHSRTSTTGNMSEEPKRDILHSDFTSHWQNLQFGRLCQGPRYPAPVVCPPPMVVPPMYLQGRFPLDGPGTPLSANANLLSQLASYGHHLVPVSPLQSDPSRPTVVYQRFADELPRYRVGTGTYLPNPKLSARDRHSSGARRNSYNYSRSDHADREGNWNAAKSRAAGRGSHSRSQGDKSRAGRFVPNESRADRPWAAYRHHPPSSYQSQNGSLRPNSSHGSSANVAYGMYPVPGMNLNGPTMQSVVMLNPYDHNSGYVSSADQPDFGPVGYSGPSDASQPADGIPLRGAHENQRYHRSSTQHSSPDQPSSPHFNRRI
ncbi:hypothetical protein RND81_01G204000 [Saponaria officinalis]|uniref:Polymerase nucleotidyl transferase domain-containing protein n=1 Tax=Saponaria officinalis TaxID=3572 RepID=A0AAW1NJX1_SAPOF